MKLIRKLCLHGRLNGLTAGSAFGCILGRGARGPRKHMARADGRARPSARVTVGFGARRFEFCLEIALTRALRARRARPPKVAEKGSISGLTHGTI